MAYNKAERSGDAPARRRAPHRRKKVCVFCGKDNVIDYKDVNKLKRYISERGKILPRRITGNCANQESPSRCINAICNRLIVKIKTTFSILKTLAPNPLWCGGFACPKMQKML